MGRHSDSSECASAELFQMAIDKLEEEIAELKKQDPLAPGVWISYPEGRKPQLRYFKSCGRVKSVTIEPSQAARDEQRKLIRDLIEKKQGCLIEAIELLEKMR